MGWAKTDGEGSWSGPVVLRIAAPESPLKTCAGTYPSD